MESAHPPYTPEPLSTSPATAAAAGEPASPKRPYFRFRRTELWSYFGPAFVASVAYIDPGNFATNIEGGSRFGYRLLWVLLWSNAMAILIQYLSAKLGIVTGLTLPQNCRKHFSRTTVISLWLAAEIAAIATDLAEFLGAALGFYLLFGPPLLAHGLGRTETLFIAGLITSVLVFAILALDLAGFRWLEAGIMAFVGIIGLCYGFEVFLVHPDWHAVAFHVLIPSLDTASSASFHQSIYLAVAMLGATVMPHVVYLHSALVQPRLHSLVTQFPKQMHGEEPPPRRLPGFRIRRRYLRFELIDVFVAMNGAWLINSAMIVVAAVAFTHLGSPVTDVERAYQTLGPLLGPAAATVFAVALLCSGLSSSTVGVMAGQVIIEGFLSIKFPIFLRRLITIIPALIVIAVGLDPLKILILSQVVLSFALPFALIPLLLLTNRPAVMGDFASALRTRVAGWTSISIILILNAVLLSQIAFGN
ncbi:Nramp family divalent metal transporter [Granulicella sibirica]|uniref:Divalent metal cation transporter MntH n=1 Tax=Granulicella sibirica TaxID=2479048 RepID=A0A4Q0T6Z9_9BACT|nr:Nramp family divalent metal transporter [Granulicella sibirica]RXH58802.1 Manganese transport protein MntH [Granulicella sibirica]